VVQSSSWFFEGDFDVSTALSVPLVGKTGNAADFSCAGAAMGKKPRKSQGRTRAGETRGVDGKAGSLVATAALEGQLDLGGNPTLESREATALRENQRSIAAAASWRGVPADSRTAAPPMAVVGGGPCGTCSAGVAAGEGATGGCGCSAERANAHMRTGFFDLPPRERAVGEVAADDPDGDDDSDSDDGDGGTTIDSMTFDEDDDDGEWVMGNDDDDAVQCKVVGDTTTMPEFVRTLVLKAQAELRELRGEGAAGAGGKLSMLDAAGFVHEQEIGPRAATRRPDLAEFQAPRVRFYLPDVDYNLPRPKCDACGTNTRTQVKGRRC
jgi:hypothetical protein